MNSFNLEKVLIKLCAWVEITVNPNSPVDGNKGDCNGRVDNVSKVSYTAKLLLGNMLLSPENQNIFLKIYVFVLFTAYSMP